MTTLLHVTELSVMGRPAQWHRTEDGETETIAIVKADKGAFYCAALGRETPYLVQVTDEQDKTLIGVYDLDGDQIDAATVGEWTLPPEAGDLPADVYEHVETSWESGTSTMVRL